MIILNAVYFPVIKTKSYSMPSTSLKLLPFCHGLIICFVLLAVIQKSFSPDPPLKNGDKEISPE